MNACALCARVCLSVECVEYYVCHEIFLTDAHTHTQIALTRASPYVQQSHRVSGLMMANHTSIHTVRACVCDVRRVACDVCR
jgi:hypothetical protein